MQFINPLYLIGLLAVAIPILVHLFNFRRYKKVYFSNVAMLQQLQSQNKKQSQLKHRLILLCRLLAVVFIVLVFARPVLVDDDKAVNTGGVSYVSVYLDNSFSMENTATSGTLLDAAKRKAYEIADAYKPSDYMQLITNDIEPRHFRFLSPQEFKNMVDEVEISAASEQISDMLEKQYNYLNSNVYNGEKRVYVVSDFQTSLNSFENYPTDEEISTVLVPLQSQQIANIYIDSVALSTPFLHSGATVVANVWVKNTGASAVEKVPVKLFVNDKQSALASADIPANSTQVVPLTFTIDDGEHLACRVETSDYPIVYDDKFYFSINVRKQTRVLMINSKSENKYLNMLFDTDSAFVVENQYAKAIDYDEIGSFDMVLLNELEVLPSGLVQNLTAFCNEGGSIVVVPSDNADMQSYAAASREWKMPILSGLQQVAPLKGRDINVEHRLYDGVFENRKTNDMETLTVHKYFKTQADANTIKESLIQLENGDDFLCVTPMGKGSVYLFSTAMQSSNTDFVKQALFVPTLYNMALYSSPLSMLYQIMAPINSIELAHPIVGDKVIPKLVKDDDGFEIIPELKKQGDNMYISVHNQVKTAGSYTLTIEGKGVESVSFNHDRSESVMEFATASTIKKEIENYNLNNYKVVENIDKPLSALIAAESDGVQLWKLCLVIALLSLLAEMLIVRLWK